MFKNHQSEKSPQSPILPARYVPAFANFVLVLHQERCCSITQLTQIDKPLIISSLTERST